MNIKLRYSLAGFCMGIAELIPGISGATVAVIFKVYPNLMSILSELRIKNLTLNLSSLSKTFQLSISIPLIVSMFASVVICSKGVSFLLTNFEQSFLSLLGFIMMCLSIYVVNFFKDAKQSIYLIIFLFIGAFLGFALHELNINSGNLTSIYIFFAGILAFSFFLIPGISGSAMLVVLGIYGPIIQAVASFNFSMLIPFGLGCLITLLILPKLLLSIYSKYELSLNYVFSGLIFSSGLFLF
ncbi:DUF368 domain-containing protein [Gammaproteobacteria bacterium]|jgi:putative membrane protein|nr:DUF368 domain-containing protein [Gammaproteobacteria bacterium]